MDLARRQEIEMAFWENSPDERPEADSLGNLINKISEAGIFLDLLRRYESDFTRAQTIVELGAGQGWASCVVKRSFPAAGVIATDISNRAVASAAKWESLFQVRLDGAFACRCYELPIPDSSVDVVFCFAAAHHFVAHRRTVGELRRVLAPGGRALYLYEPSCSPICYPLAYRRVNHKRPEVPEDVLILPKLLALGSEAGLTVERDFYPSTRYRSTGASLYYSVLARAPLLQQILPCTVNYRFTKPRA